jgi:uncharacterized membrane protein
MVAKNPRGPDAANTAQKSIVLDHRKIIGILILLIFVLGVGMILQAESSEYMAAAPVAVAIWSVAAFTLLILYWRMILRSTPGSTRCRATPEDPRRLGLLIISVGASIAALVTVVMLTKYGGQDYSAWLLLLALPTIASAWALLHTIFTLHYARLYYRDDEEPGGLLFPRVQKRGGPHEPDDLDFAYLSFMIGMAFQSGDVDVCNRSMRLHTLIHGAIAFAFNTAILALTLNVVYDLIKGCTS